MFILLAITLPLQLQCNYRYSRMKIAILGYGKMGRIIEKVALSRNHEVILKVGSQNSDELTTDELRKADVVIEFSTPDTVLRHIKECFNAQVPVIVGTTGWYENLEEIKHKCEVTDNTLLYASNFSIGVNVFFQVNKLLAKLMNTYPNYEVQVEEIHHAQKIDAPSGTAITIAEGIIESLNDKKGWFNMLPANNIQKEKVALKNDQLLIESLRIDQVPGTHSVVYNSEEDTIEFKHIAHNRNGFALGTLLAAEWVINKKGFYSVDDMFSFNVTD